MKKIPVPLIKQTKLACGPTCLAMILKYYKDEKSLSEIIKSVDGIKNFGARAIQMVKYVRKLGYQVDCFSYDEKMAKGYAKIVKPSKKLILKYLKKRIPVIIAVRLFLLKNEDYSNSGHYIIIIKYNKGTFWYIDPSFAKEFKIKKNDLMFAWFNNVLKSTGYMLVIKPKG